MVMFFKKKKVKNISHILFSTIHEDSLPIARILELSDKHAYDFSVNFGKDRKIETLVNELQTISLYEIEDLAIYDSDGNLIVGFQMSFAFLDSAKPIYQLVFVRSFDISFTAEIKLFNIAEDLGFICYGYARLLREDYCPVSEIKIKKGLFTDTLDYIKESDQWLINPKQLCNGAFKAFYPLNYFNPKTLNVLKEHIGDIKLTSHPQNDCIFLIDESTQKQLLKNRALKKYLHFTST